jgi:hypothetical protein
MSYERLAYDDQDSAHQMHEDCSACRSSMRMPRRLVEHVDVVLGSPPPLTYDAFPDEVPKREITITEAAAHLASRMHLHLD